MDNETGVQAPSIHTLIPLEDFKALLGVDDRDDKSAVFALSRQLSPLSNIF
jgi:hypothetical protein